MKDNKFWTDEVKDCCKAIGVAAIICACLLLGNTGWATSWFQGTFSPYTNIANLGVAGAYGGSTNTNGIGTIFTLDPGNNQGLELTLSCTPTNNGTSNVVAGFNFYNGVTWTTDFPLLITNACGGSNITTAHAALVAAASVLNVQAIRLDEVITQQTNNVPIAVSYSFFR